MKPAPPIGCVTSRAPGSRSGLTVSCSVGSTTFVRGPVSVVTLRSSREEKRRTVMPFEPALTDISTAASQSLTKTSSGPP